MTKMAKKGIAMTVGSKETTLSIDEAKQFFVDRMTYVQGREDTQHIDASMLLLASKYNLEGARQEQISELADEAVNRLIGIENNFQAFTVESLLRMNKEYFTYLVNASYSQNTMASDVVAQGIGASEMRNGNIFTTVELIETAAFIVDDYPSFAHHVSSARMPVRWGRFKNEHPEKVVDIFLDGGERDLKDLLVQGEKDYILIRQGLVPETPVVGDMHYLQGSLDDALDELKTSTNTIDLME